MNQVACSVIIPTFNAAHLIHNQFAALAAQVDAPEFEVVVADNASTDDLSSMVRAWQNRLPHLRIVDASRKRGVSAARNDGIRSASTDRIMICDADDVVSAGWVKAFHDALEDYALVGGPVETVSLSGRAASWVRVPQASELPRTWGDRRYAFGGNVAMGRHVFDTVGGFDEEFPAGAEEIDFAWRARDLGFEAQYVPDALLHYRIRTDLRGVMRQQYNSGRGTATLYSKFRPVEVVPKSALRRLHHEFLLLRSFPLRGSADDRRGWFTQMAFEAGKLVEARRLGCPSP